MLPNPTPAILMKAYPENLRMQLRSTLLVTRGTFSNGMPKKVLICPICQQTVSRFSPPDLHEALITRHYVEKVPHYAWLINHPCNVVFRHHQTKWCWHTAGIGGDEVFELCAIHLVKFEGYENVLAYLEAMAEIIPFFGNKSLKRFQAMEWIV